MWSSTSLYMASRALREQSDFRSAPGGTTMEFPVSSRGRPADTFIHRRIQAKIFPAYVGANEAGADSNADWVARNDVSL